MFCFFAAFVDNGVPLPALTVVLCAILLLMLMMTRVPRAEGNPPPSVLWRKLGHSSIFRVGLPANTGHCTMV